MTGRDIHDVMLLVLAGEFRTTRHTSRRASNGSLYIDGMRVGDVVEFRNDGHQSGKTLTITAAGSSAPRGNRAQRRRS